MPDKYKAMVLSGAFAGLRWGEAAGLTRASVDVLRSRITVASTAVDVRGHVTLGHEPKTSRSKRTVPVARSVIRRVEEHLATFVGPEPDALVFTAPRGGPLARSLFPPRLAAGRHPCWDPQRHLPRPAAQLVAILVAAGCNFREVSEWAGHNSVAFTLTRCGGLFENGSETAVHRLDLLLGGSSKVSGNVLHLDTRAWLRAVKAEVHAFSIPNAENPPTAADSVRYRRRPDPWRREPGGSDDRSA